MSLGLSQTTASFIPPRQPSPLLTLAENGRLFCVYVDYKLLGRSFPIFLLDKVLTNDLIKCVKSRRVAIPNVLFFVLTGTVCVIVSLDRIKIDSHK